MVYVKSNKQIMSLRLLLDKFVWIMTMYFQINCHCNFDVAFNNLRNKSGTLKGTFCYHHHHLSVRIRESGLVHIIFWQKNVYIMCKYENKEYIDMIIYDFSFSLF